MSDIGSAARATAAADALAALLALDVDLLDFDDEVAIKRALDTIEHLRQQTH